MLSINSKYGEVKIFAETFEQEALGQVIELANSPLGENAHIRMMPDMHLGTGCCIGTTLKITDKVCPGHVGVDIGCGVDLIILNERIGDRLEELDKVIRENIPYGMNVHKNPQINEEYFARNLYCWESLKKETKETAIRALGSLGGGNHFIEAYGGGTVGAISVHSGSRNIGYKVAQYYQNLAEKNLDKANREDFSELLKEVPPQERESFIKKYKEENPPIKKDLAYLVGEEMEHYLHDMRFMQKFAELNRGTMLQIIQSWMGLSVSQIITSTHNYISDDNILRKGAISARRGELLVIPMNMRDGLLVCRGLGNEDWNNSAPHGAGRLYSRSKAKELFSVDDYRMSMEGIYTTCVNESTLDEAPFVYKDQKEIEEAIQPTVIVEDHLIPIYNFKAN